MLNQHLATIRVHLKANNTLAAIEEFRAMSRFMQTTGLFKISGSTLRELGNVMALMAMEMKELYSYKDV